MSDTWIGLLSGVVGAIVGGAASLAGTMLVNRMQMAASARMRIYDELLPRLGEALAKFQSSPTTSVAGDEAEQEVSDVLLAICRATTVAGRRERAVAQRMIESWKLVVRAARECAKAPTPLPGGRKTPSGKLWLNSAGITRIKSRYSTATARKCRHSSEPSCDEPSKFRHSTG